MLLTSHVGGGVGSGDPLDVGLADTGSSEDDWGVNGHTSDTNPFLHNLKPDDKLDATTNVEFTRSRTSEHGPLRCA